MVAAEAGDGRDAVEEGHVEVDHDGVRLDLVGQFQGLKTVGGGAGDAEEGLLVDQAPKRFEKRFVVVGQEHAYGCHSHCAR